MESITPFWIFVCIFATLLGLFIGSFLNVVALRLLKEESVVSPPSHCPKCKTPLKFYDNIPILSYIILGGKCRGCKEGISIQYPLVEFSTAFLFLLCVVSFGISFKTIGMMFIVVMLVVITVTDLYEQLIFDVTSLTLIPVGLAYNLFNLGNIDRPDFVFQLLPKSFGVQIPGFLEQGAIHLPGIFTSAIVGIVIAVVFFEGLSWLSEVLLGKYGFGMGDTKLCAGLAAWFGWEMLVLIIIISFLVQAVIGLPFIMYNLYKAEEKKAFYSLIATLIFAAIPILTNYVGPINPKLNLLITLVSFVVVIVCLMIFLKQSKKRETFAYLPLGPAIVIGALVVMFYFDSLQNWYTHLFTLFA